MNPVSWSWLNSTEFSVGPWLSADPRPSKYQLQVLWSTPQKLRRLLLKIIDHLEVAKYEKVLHLYGERSTHVSHVHFHLAPPRLNETKSSFSNAGLCPFALISSRTPKACRSAHKRVDVSCLLSDGFWWRNVEHGIKIISHDIHSICLLYPSSTLIHKHTSTMFLARWHLDTLLALNHAYKILTANGLIILVVTFSCFGLDQVDHQPYQAHI